ncbi:alpha/beta fold hydrolase [Streptomyces broussonetiae]|uniref:alpha/beta fold hydrolase n=1 Tax=Streptomyces broussonetiae TaxID=2686304 RepID=UPI0035DC3670
MPQVPTPTPDRAHRLVPSPAGRIHLVEQGRGPLVLLVHGFPESWYSWRHQLPALAAAGYRAVALDVRGYGRSSRPAAVDAYRMLDLVADNVAVVEALGEESAVVVGHDWGASIAAASALTRPDVFRAVALLSVPYTPPGGPRPSEVFARMGGSAVDAMGGDGDGGRGTVGVGVSGDGPGGEGAGGEGAAGRHAVGGDGRARDDSEDARPGQGLEGAPASDEFYVSYFQRPGRAEAEIEPDVRGWLAGFYAALSADTMPAPGARDPHFVAPGGTLRERFPTGPLPAWLEERDLDVLAGEFERTGLTGALNRYRNMDRDWADLAGYEGAPITQPSLFVAGALDASLAWLADAVKAFPETLPGLLGSHVLDGCGHFVQQERPEETNRILLAWLTTLTS